MKKRWMISIGVVAIAVGIGAAIWVPDYLEIKKAQAVVEKNLNDPDSAIFRNAVVARESIPDKGIEYVYVCGEVNAKNRMGGYVGYNEYNDAGGALRGGCNTWQVFLWVRCRHRLVCQPIAVRALLFGGQGCLMHSCP